MDLPPEQPVPLAHIEMCVTQAVREHPGLTPWMIKTIIATEGGRSGTVTQNTNDSKDLGVMQINTINVPAIQKKFGFSYRDLVVSPCRNIMAGSWLLYTRLVEAKGKAWLAIGNYHSKTPSKRRIYLRKAVDSYVRLAEGAKQGRASAAMGRTTDWGKVDGQRAVPSLVAIENSLSARPTQAKTQNSGAKVVEIENKKSNLRFIE